ncbi:protein PELPK1-like [Forsythia ovata]|uniref:Protein PELPK1-like n=1 Tax=Forsythia ovata TaxID=205694 RepID=A0ABD1U9X5_9LAMI
MVSRGVKRAEHYPQFSIRPRIKPVGPQQLFASVSNHRIIISELAHEQCCTAPIANYATCHSKLPQPLIPKVAQPPLPAVPNLPQATLPPLPAMPTVPTLPKPTLPPIPSSQFPSLRCQIQHCPQCQR